MKLKLWAFAMLMLHLLLFLSFLMAVGLGCPSFEGFWEGQNIKGLGLGWLPQSRLKSKGWDRWLLLPLLQLMLHLEGLVGGVVAL